MPRKRLSKEDIAKATEMKKSGCLDKDIAAYMGVRPETFSRWINNPKSDNQNQLAQALKRVETEYKANLLKIIYNAGVCGTWQAAAWLLERKYPHEYARQDRVKPDTNVDKAPCILLGVEPKAIDDKGV